MSLGSSKTDFERCRNGILGLETLKEPNRYSELELGMKSVEGLRQQYQRKREGAFDSVKADIQKRVEVAARKVAKQAGNRKLSVDIESSVEASVKTSPKWRDFLIEHEKTFGQKFDDWLTGMKGLI